MDNLPKDIPLKYALAVVALKTKDFDKKTSLLKEEIRELKAKLDAANEQIKIAEDRLKPSVARVFETATKMANTDARSVLSFST